MKRKRRYPRPIKPKFNKALEQVEQERLCTDIEAKCVDAQLSRNEDILKNIFKNCSDVVFRKIKLEHVVQIIVVYIDGLIDNKYLDEIIINPLAIQNHFAHELEDGSEYEFSPVGKVEEVSSVREIVNRISKGEALFFLQGSDKAKAVNISGWAQRGIDEPPSEQVIRGPREGFVETLRINTSMIRRKIHSPLLKMESYVLGTYTQTDVAVVYIDGLVRDTVLNEVRLRIQKIEIDGILESGYIEDFIEDNTFSIFPTIQNTERPDVVAANLLEGKVAILVDGTPFALVVPMTFWSALNASEDYYERFLISTALRLVRYALIFIALLLPSIYVSLISYQQEMVPTTLLLSIAAAQEATPFPAIVEAIGMEFMFEGLREAGIRLPKPVGSAISIVGALVIGQAAVQAGIVSAPMVIVVATTGIASFTIPQYNLGIAIRILRFPILILSGVFGFYGITIGLLGILIHLVTIRSFGSPYLSPVSPLFINELKDVFYRAPWWAMRRRPHTASSKNRTRVTNNEKRKPQ